MEFIVFGVGFGLIFGLGLFMLVIWPALKERKEEERKAKALRPADQQDHNK
jgi:hypothetical protein